MEEKPDEQRISIRIHLDVRKFNKLLEIMPSYQNDGTKTKAVYWAIDEAIRQAIAPKPTEQKHYSNREYLRRG